MIQRSRLVVGWLLLVGMTLWDAATHAQQGKGPLRKVTAEEVVQAIKTEQATAAVVMGRYFEFGPVKAAEAVEVIRAAAAHKELSVQLAVMVALAPEMSAVVQALLDTQPTPADRLQAALILATHARIADLDSRIKKVEKAPAKKKAKKTKLRGPAHLEKIVGPLLNDADPLVVELAMLAAAYARLEGLKDKVLSYPEADASLGIQAAKLLYCARLDLEVTEQQVDRVFAKAPAQAPEFTKISPALSSFDVRVPSWCVACEALAEIKQDKYLKHLLQAASHPDLRVQIDAIHALEALESPVAVPALLEKLPDSPWPVQIAILSALGAIPSKDAVVPLINLLEKEKGRLRQDINYALASIAGKQEGQTADIWKQWWDEVKSDFRVDRERTHQFRAQNRVQDMGITAQPTGQFYDLTLYSDRLVFVLDTSNSMRGDKIASLKKELSQTLKLLKPHVRFNIVNFGGVVEVMQPAGLMTNERLSDALKRVANAKLTLGTRSYDALEAGMLLPELDTVVFLSDGLPAGGKFQAWERIVSAIGLWNRYRPIAIHTLEFKDDKKKTSTKAAQMADLAERNAGRSSTPRLNVP